MFRGKAAYLSKLTQNINLKSVDLNSNKLDGSTPPGVFIGQFGYPKVYVGPMLTTLQENCELLDLPELWLQQSRTSKEIVSFRLNLIRGKVLSNVKDLNNKFVNKLQEIALAKKSVYSEAEFKSKPRGFCLHEEFQPFGPSAELQRFEIGNVKWQKDLQKAYYDRDLLAAEAVKQLYSKGVFFSQIQKALSVGAFGLGKNRKLVPTRWAITAVDDILGKWLLEDVKQSPIIDNYLVFEFSALNNYFAVLLMPTLWQYENFEAFIKILGNEVLIYGDWEPWTGRKEYSEQGGCYYSIRFAIAEYLKAINRQAGAIVLREAYPGYIPLGVWAIRESVRSALKQTPKEFHDLRSAIAYMSSKLRLPISEFINRSVLLKTASQQTKLCKFFSLV